MTPIPLKNVGDLKGGSCGGQSGRSGVKDVDVLDGPAAER